MSSLTQCPPPRIHNVLLVYTMKSKWCLERRAWEEGKLDSPTFTSTEMNARDVRAWIGKGGGGEGRGGGAGGGGEGGGVGVFKLDNIVGVYYVQDQVSMQTYGRVLCCVGRKTWMWMYLYCIVEA